MNNFKLKKAVEYMIITKFGAYISKPRKEHDMPQSQLAEKLNVICQAVSRGECGEGFLTFLFCASLRMYSAYLLTSW